MIRHLAGTILAVVVAAPAIAREALDFQAMHSGRYRGPVDLSAYAPGADAKPPTHRFEGRLKLRGTPSTRTLVADKDYLDEADIAVSKTWPDDFDYAFVIYRRR